MATKLESTPDVLSDQRWQMIAEAAYFRAEARGFWAGDPVQDWLESEIEIDTLLAQGGDAQINANAEKESLLKRLETLLHDWDHRIEEFTSTIRDTRDKLGAEIHEQIAALAQKRAMAEQKVAALRSLSTETWQEMRDHTLHLFDEIQTSIEHTATKLKAAAKSVRRTGTTGGAGPSEPAE
ncbi:MAG: DUF2934 domain-containing protein [Gammaproteobacteria bacterium]|nr:DUF2934 domain-containing protein [Gammaproteobacteria bacterium]